MPLTRRPAKRIEVVLLKDALTGVTKQLDALGISGYSIIDDVLGRGERGLRAGIGLGAFQYRYLLIACDESKVEPIVTALGPILEHYGGLCLVSDAEQYLG